MLVQRAWTIDSVVSFLFWVFAGLVGVVLLGAAAEYFFTEQPESVRLFYASFVGMLIFYGAVTIGLVRLLRANQTTWIEAFGFQRLGGTQIVRWSVAAAIVLFGVNFLFMLSSNALFRWLEVEAPMQDHIQMLQESQDFWRPFLIGFMALFLAPVMEEILFRGLLYPGVKAAGYPRVAWWGTALLFALSHGNLLSFAPLVVFGLAMTWLYERTNNLAVPILTHLLFNLVNLLLALLLR